MCASLAACGENTAPAGSSSSASAPAPSASAAATPAGSGSAAVATDTPGAPRTFNVILVTMDAVRADEMPWQGYGKDTAPNIGKLAAAGTAYTNAYSVSSYTAKSVSALFSGKYPRTLYRDPSFFAKFSKANVWFTELLHAKGVHTIGVQGHLYFDKGKNLSQGFDVWRQPKGLEYDPETDPNVTSPDMTKLGEEILGDAKNTDGRFFAWFHYGDPHDKYKAHPESPDFGKGGRALYDNEIHYTDSYVQKLFDFCATKPWWKDTIVIVSADHGEAFGEHGQYFHGFALWQNLVRVPLVVHGPGIKAQKIDLARSAIDLAPTIVELLGLPPDPGFAGKSLVPELFGREAPASHEPILLDLPADSYNPPTRAMVRGDWKLIEDPGPKYRLFNIKEDPGEENDLAKQPKSKAQLDEMKQAFEEAWKPYPYVAPWPGHKLVGGGKDNGPFGPEGWGNDPDADAPKGSGKAQP